jgi:hypothetical protein
MQRIDEQSPTDRLCSSCATFTHCASEYRACTDTAHTWLSGGDNHAAKNQAEPKDICMTDLTNLAPLFKFDFPLGDDDDLASAYDKLHYDRAIRDLDLARVAEWLAGMGVISGPDPQIPRRIEVPPHLVNDYDEPTREGRQYIGLCQRVRWHGAGGELAFTNQIWKHLDAVREAMRNGDGPLGDRLKAFMSGLARAQDGAKAALDAGYFEWPMPQLFDLVTGLIAAVVDMLRGEVMERVLDGQISGDAATDALATLHERWSPQAEANARWFRAKVAAKPQVA